ncbi:MAG: pyridoxal phosphate-dependent decarboxylase family protein [Gemmatimonadales bacterium]
MEQLTDIEKTVAQSFPLELSGDQMRQMVDAAMQRIITHIDTLAVQASADTDGAKELALSLVESMPERGKPLEELLDLLFDRVIPKSFNTAAPGYLAYIPGGGVPHAAVADLIANAVNRYVGVFVAAPGLAQLEANVIRWFCEMVGFGKGSAGFLTSGGSLANFSAVVTARRELLPENFLAGTIYASDQTHHSVMKAAVLAGFPEGNVRMIQSDDLFRIRTDVLEQHIVEDRARGKVPFLVVGSAGTTNTGAVDDLTELADVAERHRMWFHVDAAYGGFFMLTRRGHERLRGIDRADSVTLDPHKGLFLPYGSGSLLVRDGDALRRAHQIQADYLPRMQEDEQLVDFCQISPELSRPFRGLAVWLPIKMQGIEPFRANLDEKLDLTEWATEELRQIEGIEIAAEPQLSIVAFRLERPGAVRDDLNRLNRKFIDRINAKKRIYVTGTVLGGLFTIRICVLSFRTHIDRMREGLEDIRTAVAETF